MCDHIDNMGPKCDSFYYQIQILLQIFMFPSSFTEDFYNFWWSHDVLCGMLPESSLCSLCSSAACLAQTCFTPPPLNSLLSERGQRPGTVTYPEGGWRTPHLPSFHERWAVPPHLYFVYTWVPYSLLDHLTTCRKSCCIQFPALFWFVLMDQ